MSATPAAAPAGLPAKWRWFAEARFGMFIHWGPYAQWGRGEQVMIRELVDQEQYARRACAWTPDRYDARAWARVAKEAGCRYAVLTTRHHDGFCLWDSRLTDYTSVQQAAKRDLVREYCDAFRAEGLKVGLYYSLADWRIPAYFDGPRLDPQGWARFSDYVHGQVRELLTSYGEIAEFWFDGAWPRSSAAWGAQELLAMMRALQPAILINNRLDSHDPDEPADHKDVERAGASATLGDFGTPEHHITAEGERPWESCNTANWRLWGWAAGERWRGADQLLDMLTEAASKGGNLLLNVGPTPSGELPAPFVERMQAIGRWMRVHEECIRGSEAGEDVGESVTWGRVIRRGNHLYLVVRFWDGRGELTLYGLQTRVRRAMLLTTGQELSLNQGDQHVTVSGLPQESPSELFPVIRLDCDGAPKRSPRYAALWNGDPRRYSGWARSRGTSVWNDGRER